MDNFDIYLHENRMWNFEGSTGVKNLKKIIKDVCGYNDHYGNTLETFLMDNPGAVEAVVEWIREYTDHIEEWQENLNDQIIFDDEEDEVIRLKDERNGVYPEQWNVAN